MKRFTLLIALLACSVALVSAQEYGVTYTRYVGHITTATTTHVTTNALSTLYTLVFNVTGSPTSEVVTVQTAETTPKILYKSAALAAATTVPVVVALPVGIKCSTGIDIVTSGTVNTGVVDAWAAFR